MDRKLCYHETCATKKCRHGQYFEEDVGMVWTTRYQVQTLFNLPTNYNESETNYDEFVVLVF